MIIIYDYCLYPFYQVAEASNSNQYNLYIFQKSYKRVYRMIIKMGVGGGDDKIIDRNDKVNGM